MIRLVLELKPLSAFASKPTGGMLFGHLVWAARERLSEDGVKTLLDGYLQGRPFAVLSDLLPKGFVPMPALPLAVLAPNLAAGARKDLKAKRWLPEDALSRPVEEWAGRAKSSAQLREEGLGSSETAFVHNSISRATGTTGKGAFAPYEVASESFLPEHRWSLHVVLDEERLSVETFLDLIRAVGMSGFGRDASTGMGRFEVLASGVVKPFASAKSWVTLSAMAPQRGGWDPERCFYRPLTYFGRHGNDRALGSGVFKKPIVLAECGALLTLREPSAKGYAGQGIGGHSAFADTVHQGYAPMLPVSASFAGER